MKKPPYSLIFFSSLSVLTFEVSLIRIFSIHFSYHYASIIVSISMMGMVLGGLWTYVIRVPQGSQSIIAPHLKGTVFSLSLSYPLILILAAILPLDYHRMLWEREQMFYLIIFILALTVPFLLYGRFISLLLAHQTPMVHRLYTADLAGAATGVIFVSLLLTFAKPEYVVLSVSLLLAAILSFREKRAVLRALYIIVPLICAIPIVTGIVTTKMSPFKSLMQGLREDGAQHRETLSGLDSRLDIFENPRMKFAPGLSLVYKGKVPNGVGLAIDGNVTGVMIEEGDLKKYDFLSFLPSALPYLLRKPSHVLLIGLRNGVDALTPYYFGAGKVSIAEKDGSIVRYLEENFRPGSLYRESLYHTTGRRLAGALSKMDIIYISKTGFFPTGSFGLQEDYDVTVEALRLYLSTLREDGLLFVQIFLLPPPRYELRTMANILAALMPIDSENTNEHLMVFRSWDTMNYLVSKRRFTAGEREIAARFTAEKGFDMVIPRGAALIPFISGVDYGALFEDLQNTGSDTGRYPFDIRPTTDNRPFFNYFFKTTALPTIYRLSGGSWVYFIYEGMALPFILVFLVLMSVVIFALVFLITRFRPGGDQSPDRTLRQRSGYQERAEKPAGSLIEHPGGHTLFTSLLYFAAIGLAFMCVEVFFIHSLALPFGSPVLAFSFTLAGLLVSSGCGSILSSTMRKEKGLALMLPVPVLLFFYALLPGSFMGSPYALLLTIPAGLSMGVYFPAGIRRFSGRQPGLVPLLYAMNGASSIIAPPLASLTAVAWGLHILLFGAAALYCLAMLCYWLQVRRSAVNSRVHSKVH